MLIDVKEIKITLLPRLSTDKEEPWSTMYAHHRSFYELVELQSKHAYIRAEFWPFDRVTAIGLALRGTT